LILDLKASGEVEVLRGIVVGLLGL